MPTPRTQPSAFLPLAGVSMQEIAFCCAWVRVQSALGPCFRGWAVTRGAISIISSLRRQSMAPLLAFLLPVSLLVTTGPANVYRSVSEPAQIMMKVKPPKSKSGKGGKAKAAKAATGGGFGAPKPPPPTFDEVVGAWKTREPSDTSVDCACGVKQSYKECCQPYHNGDKVSESPEWCLRSRYTAFAYRLPEYIIRTTDKTNSDYNADKIKWARKLNKEQMFDDFKFFGLEVGEVEDGASEDEEYLNMRVSLMPLDAAGLNKQPDPMVFSERSRFLKHPKSGAWLYAAGEVRTEAAGFAGRVLNSDKDLDSMKTDVDYVQSLLKKEKGELVDEIKERLTPDLPFMKKD